MLNALGGLNEGASPSLQVANMTPENFSLKDEAVWFVDSFCLRVEDIYCFTGDLIGIYGCQADHMDDKRAAGRLFKEFLVYCKLAVKSGALKGPRPWDWKATLDYAAESLMYAVEKSDITEKYAKKQVMPTPMGMRMLAESMLGTSVYQGGVSENHRDLERKCNKGCILTRLKNEQDFFEDVGGAALWKKFLSELERNLVESRSR